MAAAFVRQPFTQPVCCGDRREPPAKVNGDTSIRP
jgi:hypothetical protein